MTYATILLATAQTLLWASLYYLFPATLLEWENQFAWNRSDLTLAFTLGIAVSAIFSPLAGRLIDRGHGPLMLTVCSFIGGALLWLMSHVTTLTGFYLLWLGIGVAMAGCLYEPCFAFLIRYRLGNAKQAITVITLVAGFASTICFPATHYLLTHYGLPTAINAAASTVIFIAVPMVYLSCRYIQAHSDRQPITRDAKPQHAPSRYQFLNDRKFWLLATSFSLLGLTHGVVISHLLPIFDERAVPAATAILIASLLGPMQVLGRIVSIFADRRLNLITMTLCCFIGINIALSLFLIAGDQFWLLVGFVLFQGGSYGVISIMKPMVTRELMGDSNFGVISGSLALPYLLCSAFAPYIGSLIWQQGDYDTVLTVMLMISAAALTAFGILAVNSKKAAISHSEQVEKEKLANESCC